MSTPVNSRILDEEKPLSASLLWELQSRFYSEMGFEAWRSGNVPQYITTNPTIANSYAELIFGFYSDRNALSAPDGFSDTPLYILEIGAGSGKFAFSLLKRLEELCVQNDVLPASFVYVLSDFTQKNLDFWKGHPRLRPFLDIGMADMAVFDLSHPEAIRLQVSGKEITTGSLAHPLIVLANYVLDSIPADLVYFEQQQAWNCLVSVRSKRSPDELNAEHFLDEMEYRYTLGETAGVTYPEPYLNDLVELYAATQEERYVLLPVVALRSLHTLKSFSQNGLLLLTADKGYHEIEGAGSKSPPELVRHGSFSLNANYHAFKICCENENGLALFPDKTFNNLNIGCLFWMDDAGKHLRTKNVYSQLVSDFGPDDFFSIVKFADLHTPTMTIRDFVVFLRLSRFDPHLLQMFIGRISELAPTLQTIEKHELKAVINRTWNNYYPMGETNDLANAIAEVMFRLGDYAFSLVYFNESMIIYGENTGTLCNIASCYFFINDYDRATAMLNEVLAHEPGNTFALDLLEKCRNTSVSASEQTDGR